MLTMSKNTSTPLTFWLDSPLRELTRWIEANNELIEEQREETK